MGAGETIYESENCIVRVVEKDGKLVLAVHRVENGQELLPRGYLIGDNLLLLRK